MVVEELQVLLLRVLALICHSLQRRMGKLRLPKDTGLAQT